MNNQFYEPKLISYFGQTFKPIDRPVRDEDIIVYLDRNLGSHFDRETFAEIRMSTMQKWGKLTPETFALTYNSAVDILGRNEDRLANDIKHIDSLMNKVRGVQGELRRVEFTELYQEPRNIKTNPKFSFVNGTEVCNFSDGFSHYMTVQELMAPQKVHVDDLPNAGGVIPAEFTITEGGNMVRLADGSNLQFNISVSGTNPEEAYNNLSKIKIEKQEKRGRLKAQREMLMSTFKPVYFGNPYTVTFSENPPMPNIIKIFLAMVILLGLIALFLNFERCVFFDLICVPFIIFNIVAARKFNLFVYLRVAITFLITILLDLIWLFTHLRWYKKGVLPWDNRKLQKWVVAMTVVFILLKIGILVQGFLLHKSDDPFFQIGKDQDYNEADVDYILMNKDIAMNAGFLQN